MDIVAEMRQELREIRRQLSEMHRLARVTAVDHETALLTVQSENLIQKEVPFFTMRAGEDQTYWLPSVGEMGFLIAPCGISANSIFLPGIFFKDFPPGDMNPNVSKRIFRDGTVEEIDTENHHYKLTIEEETERLADSEKVQDSFGKNVIKIDADETKVERPAGNLKIDNAEIRVERSTGLIKLKVGAGEIDLNTFVANIVGALIFSNGITALQTGMGPVFFSKGSTPGTLPTPSPETLPDGNGNATRIPPSTVAGIGMPAGTFTFTLPPIPVISPGGTPIGTTAATPVPVSVVGTGITLVIPAKGL